MVYFNYFIKQVIRRFVRLFFTKKTFIIMLIFVTLFFFLRSEGYCSSDILLTPTTVLLYGVSSSPLVFSAFPSGSLDTPYGFFSYYIHSGVSYRISMNGFLTSVKSVPFLPLSFDTSDINSVVGYNKGVVSSSSFSVYNGRVFTSGFDGWVLVPISDFSSSSFELYQLDTLFDGDFSDISASFNTQSIYLSTSGQLNSSPISDAASYVVSLKPNTDYTYTYNVKSTNSGLPRIAFSNSFPSPGVSVNGYSSLSSPLGTNTKTFNSGNYKYFIFSFRYSEIDSFNITYYGQSGGLDDAISDVGSSVEAGTSKIDGTLNNSNVTVETDLPEDNTTDITESGFNSIFTTIRNTFTSSNSQDLVLTIPFTGKSFTINFQNVYRWF